MTEIITTFYTCLYLYFILHFEPFRDSKRKDSPENTQQIEECLLVFRSTVILVQCKDTMKFMNEHWSVLKRVILGHSFNFLKTGFITSFLLILSGQLDICL